MPEYGMIFNKSNIKQQLAEANRDYYGRKTWENLFSSVDLTRQQESNVLKRDYAEAISDAYSSAYKTNMNIMASNIGQGYKLEAMTDTDIALEQAYDSYRNNYLKAVSEVEASAAKATQQIDEALTEQADYTKQLADAPYKYLTYMYDRWQKGEDANSPFATGTWDKYLRKDEEGNIRLATWEELAAFGAQDPDSKEWTGMFDDKGNLTVKGVDFYDQMFNEMSGANTSTTFGAWLSEENPELFSWASSYNPYDYTDAGTNLGSFKTMVGMTSTDQKYAFIERFGGLTEKELNAQFDGFTKQAEELSNRIASSDGTNTKDITNGYINLLNDVKVLTDKLGITEDFEKSLNMSFSDVANVLAAASANQKGKNDLNSEALLDVLAGFGAGSAGGAAAAGAMKLATSSAFLGASTAAGPLGWAAAALVGLIGGSIYSRVNFDKKTAANKQYVQEVKNAYTNFTAQLVTYAQNKRRQQQINAMSI